MTRVSIEVVGDTVTARAELTKLLTTTERLGEVYNSEFAKMAESTLRLQVAQGNLAVSTARYSAGSLGAARATLAYRKEVDALQLSQLAAVRKVGAGLSRYVTAPTLIAGLAAAKFATDFQSHMLLIQTQAGASADEVKNLSGQVLKLAQSGAQQGPVKLADGLYHLESVGLRGTAAMNALKVASNAAAEGMAPLEDVATALAGAITSNIQGAQDYQQAMGTLNATIGAGNMKMEDLLGALGTGLLPKAKNAGVSLTEVGAALAVLTDRGMGAEQAATRLGQTFAFMEKQTPAAAKALADMGINADDIKRTIGQPNGLLTVLQMLADGMDKVGKVRGRSDLLTAFGGGRSSGALLTLLQSLDSSVSSYQSKVAQIQQTSSDLANSEAAQQKTAAASFHKDLASMEADLVGLGKAILPTVTALADGAAKIGGAFGELPGPIKHDIGAVIGLLAVSGPLLLAIVGVKRMIRTIGTEFGMLPAEAAPGITATAAELETGIGGAAAAADAEVATLRASLLSLGGLGAISIPIILAFAYKDLVGGNGKSYNQAATNSVSGGQAYNAGNGRVWVQIPGRGGYWIDNPTAGPPGQASAAADAAAKGRHGEGLATQTPLGGRPPAVARGPVPLTAQQKLQDALIANPNDVALLQQQAANDKSTVAWAERMRNEGRMDNTKFQTVYKQYMSDLVSTEAQISQVTKKTTSTQTSEARKRLTAAQDAERVIIADAKAAVDRAKLTRGTIKDDELALYHLIAVYGAESRNKALPATTRATAGQNAAATQDQLAALRNQYTVPLALQLEAAKGQAENSMALMIDAAKKTKAAALAAIHSGTLSMQGMVTAWDTITQANQTLGQGVAVTAYKAANVIKMTAGLGLNDAVRRSLEMRYAQAMEHGGRVPTGLAALGIPLESHTTVQINGQTITKHVTRTQARTKNRVAKQARGR